MEKQIKKIFGLIFTVIIIFGGSVAIAEIKPVDMDKIYNDALNTAMTRAQQPEADISKIDFAKKFENTKGNSYFTANPPEAAHYDRANDGQGVDFLENTGRASIDKSEGAKAVWGNLGRGKIKIDPNEPWLAKSEYIIKDATRTRDVEFNKSSGKQKTGISPEVDCKDTSLCKVEYTKKVCLEATPGLKRVCEKVPKITIIEPPHENKTYSGYITATSKTSGIFTLPVSGTIDSYNLLIISDDYDYPRWAYRYTGYLQGKAISTHYLGELNGTLSFSNSSLNVPVKKNVPITISFDTDAMMKPERYWKSASYSLVIKEEPEAKAYVEFWEEVNCNEI